jgi:HK97 gp10 family phage protein
MQRLRMEGLAELNRALAELPKATRRNALRRVLQKAAQPTADMAQGLAPRGETGILIGSIVVSTQLTRRHRGAKQNEVEVHIGPAGGRGALNYASFVEFGTKDATAHPFMRPAWDASKDGALNTIKTMLGNEVERAAARLASRRARAR